MERGRVLPAFLPPPGFSGVLLTSASRLPRWARRRSGNSSLQPLTQVPRETETRELGPWKRREEGKGEEPGALGPSSPAPGRGEGPRRPFRRPGLEAFSRRPGPARALEAWSRAPGPVAPVGGGRRGHRRLGAPGAGEAGTLDPPPRPSRPGRPLDASLQPGVSSPHLLHCLH